MLHYSFAELNTISDALSCNTTERPASILVGATQVETSSFVEKKLKPHKSGLLSFQIDDDKEYVVCNKEAFPLVAMCVAFIHCSHAHWDYANLRIKVSTLRFKLYYNLKILYYNIVLTYSCALYPL